MKKAAIAVVVGFLLSSVLGGCNRCGSPCGPVCGEPCKVEKMRKEYVCK